MRRLGFTAYLQNGGTLEQAQQIAAHESPRTTKLMDRQCLRLLVIERECGSFAGYGRQFVGGKPIQNAWRGLEETPLRRRSPEC